jgi:8-hydroxy-5-deazaflavin:NADPH oxidoreductase
VRVAAAYSAAIDNSFWSSDMKIGILGSGGVATTLAAGFLGEGHTVMLGTRDAAKLGDWRAAHRDVEIGSVAQAAAFGDVIVLAVKGSAAEAVLRAAAPGLAGKVVIDATNPIADEPPEDGVIRYFTGPNESLMERLQAQHSAARLVKAFNSVGAHLMVKPKVDGGRPTMFIAGNDAEAKALVTQLLDAFGWDSDDMGSVKAARAIEPLAMLWCIPGFLRNDWAHAFKMLRPA